MNSLARTWHLIPAQEWNQAHVDIGMLYVVKRRKARHVNLARAGTLEYLAGGLTAEEWGRGLISDRRTARDWFLENADVTKITNKASCLGSTWEWPPKQATDGTQAELAAAGTAATAGVKHTLAYGPSERLMDNNFLIQLDGVLDLLSALFGKMNLSVAKANKTHIKDLREHSLSDDALDKMEENWTLSFRKARLATAMKKLGIKPNVGDKLHFCVVTHVTCVSYALSDTSFEVDVGSGGGAQGAGGEFGAPLKKSDTNEVSGTTILLGFRAAEFSVLYPSDPSQETKIHEWEQGVPENSVIMGADASSSNADKQRVRQKESKLLADILKTSNEYLADLIASESKEAEDEEEQQEDQKEEAAVGDKRHASPAEGQPAAKAAKS